MVKTRSGDTNQDLDAAMPVKDSCAIKVEDGETDNSHQRSEKDDSYSPQSGSGWGRELRNRFVFSSNERSRSSGDCALHSRYGKQGISSRRHIRSCRVPVSLDERGRVYEEDEMMDDSDDIGIFDRADDDNDDIFTPHARRDRVRRRPSCRRRVRRTHGGRRNSTVTPPGQSVGHHVDHGSRVLHPRGIEEEEEDDVEEELEEPELSGHSSVEKQRDDNHEAEGVRRSTRQRKLLYDNFNTSWILGTQTLRGYPMFMVDKDPDKTLPDVRAGCSEGTRDGKEPHKKRRTLSGMEAAKDDVSKERASVPASTYSYDDMYSRVKRPRRPTQRILYTPQKSKSSSRKLSDVTEDEPTETQSSQTSTDDESADERGGGRREKYHLRKTKPTVDRFQANVDPPRRSSRILRSVLCNSVRRRRHRPACDDSSSSSSEEECFEHKKAKGLTKARNRCMPLNLHPGDLPPSSHLHEGQKLNRSLADVDPMSLDTSISFRHVGGLESHIRCLQEMVVFPMLYREVFQRFSIQPPKGVLFHGPPGTGKTLIARALANECSHGERKVSFFMRKGADCLSKWVGESERQLRLLFEQAYQMRPSIIFFDEIDGLAPVRSSKQDQIHASIVSTLLALMDGLDNRGEIIVIGATNRIDAIDPALRRPGRFDRELYFPLPARKERQEILRIHVSQWAQPPSGTLLTQLAEQAAGYCGSDLRALCSEAVVQGLRRRYPQIYQSSQKLLLDPNAVKVEKVDFVRARCNIVPAAHRVSPSPGRKLSALIEPLLRTSLEAAINTLKETFPHGVSRSVASNRVAHVGRPIHRPHLLVVGSGPQQGQTVHLGPALLHQMEHVAVHTLDLAALYEVSGRSPEEACIQVFQEARRNLPSIIYVPTIAQWWSLVAETLQAVFLTHLRRLDPSAPILLLATADSPYALLPEEVCSLFSEYRGEVLTMQNPRPADRELFFRTLFLTEAVRLPKESKRSDAFPELPLAPPPELPKLSEEEQKALYEQEEGTLRELRIFLREICAKLARNRQFYMFTKPVDIDEVPDYLNIIKQPMDLETMMTKIDLHRYVCAQDFLDDVDLLCRNALEYNPDRDPADKLIRHRACSLRDTAYALIKAEMDSDFETQCCEIARARRHRAESPSRFAPDFVQTKPVSSANKDIPQPQSQASTDVSNQSFSKDSNVTSSVDPVTNSPVSKPSWRYVSESGLAKKRRSSSAWARGLLSSKKKKVCVRRIMPFSADTNHITPSSTDSGQLVTDTMKHNSLENGSDSTSSRRLNGQHRVSPSLLSIKKMKLSEETQGVAASNGLTLTPMSSRSQSTTESLLDEMLEAGDDFTSTCDTASQDGHDLTCSDGGRGIKKIEQETDSGKRCVEINMDELKLLLVRTVKMTDHFPVETLVELYMQLSKCVSKYAKQWDRISLPQELEKELKRFQEHYANRNHFTAS